VNRCIAASDHQPPPTGRHAEPVARKSETLPEARNGARRDPGKGPETRCSDMKAGAEGVASAGGHWRELIRRREPVRIYR